jgi:hypothetical protein
MLYAGIRKRCEISIPENCKITLLGKYNRITGKGKCTVEISYAILKENKLS